MPASPIVHTSQIVTVRDLSTGAERPYTFVDRNPAPAAGRLNAESPVGRAVLGRRVGDEVSVITPGGTRLLRIVSVG